MTSILKSAKRRVSGGAKKFFSSKFIVAGFSVLALLVAGGSAFAQNNANPIAGSKVPGDYIVMLKNSVANDETEKIGRQFGVSMEHRYQQAFKGFAATLTPAQVTALKADPRVAAVEEDLYMSVDEQPAKVNGGQKAPVANFTATPTSGSAPLTVAFSDTSSRAPSSWAWDFDNNGTVDSTLRNPSYIYTQAGTYTVTMTASNSGGSNTKTRANLITVSGTTPDPDPTPDPTCAGAVNGTQQLGWGVDRIDSEQNSAWATCDGGNGVGVAILDTGIDLDHPDLAAGIVASADFTGKGTAEDGHGHGSHVAGIIGARRNGVGYVGVAPKSNLIAVKVLSDTGSGQISWIIAGINWAIANKDTYNIKVINMSLGGSGYTSSFETAVNNATAAGITTVVAAGNSAVDAGTYQPARFSNVITVSAMTSSGAFASYSNWGSVIDLIAPGSSVPSTYKNGSYTTMSGTSMASPHVAGAAALWLDNHSGNFATVKAALEAAGQSGPWTGDTDGIAEPMVYAKDL